MLFIDVVTCYCLLGYLANKFFSLSLSLSFDAVLMTRLLGPLLPLVKLNRDNRTLQGPQASL